MANKFSAMGRFPVRPLDYKNKSKAIPRELIIEYDVGEIWICLDDGTLVNVTASAQDVIDQTVQLLIEDKRILNAIQVILPDGTELTIQESVTTIVNWLNEFKKKVFDDHWNVVMHIPAENVDQTDTLTFVSNKEREYWSNKLDKSVVLDDLGNVIIKIPASNIITDSSMLFFTQAERDKLAGIDEQANKYIHPSHTAYKSGFYKVTTDDLGHVTAATAVVKADLNAVGIDWAHVAGVPGNATGSTDGFMSATDKAKLDGIDVGANAYVHPSYTPRTAGFYKVTVDNLGHVSTVSSVAKTDLNSLGIDWDYVAGKPGNASGTAAGFMSASDKSKLDGISPSANNYIHPTVSEHDVAVNRLGFFRIKVDSTGHVNETSAVSKADINGVGIDWSYVSGRPGNATQSAAGLMSADDKKKLDGMSSGGGSSGVTGVKGANESGYRTGNVNLTASNIGAAAASHTHGVGSITGLIYTTTSTGISTYTYKKPSGAVTTEYKVGPVTRYTPQSTSCAFIIIFAAPSTNTTYPIIVPGLSLLPHPGIVLDVGLNSTLSSGKNIRVYLNTSNGFIEIYKEVSNSGSQEDVTSVKVDKVVEVRYA